MLHELMLQTVICPNIDGVMHVIVIPDIDFDEKKNTGNFLFFTMEILAVSPDCEKCRS